jgi:hypothetical protein
MVAGCRRPRSCQRARWSDSLHHFLSKARIRPEYAPTAVQDWVYWRTIMCSLSTLAQIQHNN